MRAGRTRGSLKWSSHVHTSHAAPKASACMRAHTGLVSSPTNNPQLALRSARTCACMYASTYQHTMQAHAHRLGEQPNKQDAVHAHTAMQGEGAHSIINLPPAQKMVDAQHEDVGCMKGWIGCAPEMGPGCRVHGMCWCRPWAPLGAWPCLLGPSVPDRQKYAHA